MMVDRTTETCRRKIIIDERTVFGCCVCGGWIANDYPGQRDEVAQMVGTMRME